MLTTPRPTGSATHVHLPVELLQLIFCHLIDGHMPFFLPCARTSGDPRMQLSRVCSYWRAVALGTPQLWDDIVIDLNWRPSQFLSVAESILSWNAEPPKALTLRWKFEVLTPPSPSADEFIERLILPFASSIRQLDLYAPFPFITSLLSPQRTIQFPILEKLSISSHSILIMPILWASEFPSKLKIPRLAAVEARLCLEYTAIADAILNAVRVSQLTELAITRMLSIDICCHILSVLSSCTNLRSCSVHLGPTSDVHVQLSPVPKFVMPHLERLHIRFSSRKGFQVFVSCFTLPSIRDLALKNTVTGLGLTRAISNMLIEQCGPSLEHLFIASTLYRHRHRDFSFEGFDRVLQKYKMTLKRLYIPLMRMRMSRPRLPRSLILQLVSRDMCPNLESLSVGFIEYSGGEISGMIKDALIEADLGGRKPIKEFHMSTQCDPEIIRTWEGAFEILICRPYSDSTPVGLENEWFGTQG